MREQTKEARRKITQWFEATSDFCSTNDLYRLANNLWSLVNIPPEKIYLSQQAIPSNLLKSYMKEKAAIIGLGIMYHLFTYHDELVDDFLYYPGVSKKLYIRYPQSSPTLPAAMMAYCKALQEKPQQTYIRIPRELYKEYLFHLGLCRYAETDFEKYYIDGCYALFECDICWNSVRDCGSTRLINAVLTSDKKGVWVEAAINHQQNVIENEPQKYFPSDLEEEWPK